jgi:hypothetical protein
VLVKLLPSSSRANPSFQDAEVSTSGGQTINISTACPLQAGEQVMIRLKIEGQLVLLAYSVTSRRSERSRTLAQAQFQGFISQPGKLDSTKIATALAA